MRSTMDHGGKQLFASFIRASEDVSNARMLCGFDRIIFLTCNVSELNGLHQCNRKHRHVTFCLVCKLRVKPDKNFRIVCVRPGSSSSRSHSPWRNSIGYFSILLNRFHFTTALKDQYVGRYNDCFSFYLFPNVGAKGKVLTTSISSVKANRDRYLNVSYTRECRC